MLITGGDLVQYDSIKTKTVEEYLTLLDLKVKEAKKKPPEDGR